MGKHERWVADALPWDPNSRARCTSPQTSGMTYYCWNGPCPRHAPAQYALAGARHRKDRK